MLTAPKNAPNLRLFYFLTSLSPIRTKLKKIIANVLNIFIVKVFIMNIQLQSFLATGYTMSIYSFFILMVLPEKIPISAPVYLSTLIFIFLSLKKKKINIFLYFYYLFFFNSAKIRGRYKEF